MANTYQFVTRTSQSASVATTVVCTSGAGQAIPRKSLVVLRFANSSGVLPTSVVDSAGHTYTKATSVVNGLVVAIYFVVTTKSLPAGATFTANVAATSSSRMMDVIWTSRPGTLSTATVLDTAATNATGVATATGTGTAAATAAFSSGQANSLFVSLVGDAGAASSTPAASWTEDSDTQVTAAVLHFESQTRLETAITSTAASSTLASSVAWAMVQACFKMGTPIAYVKTATWNNTSSPPSTLAATVTQSAAIGDHILVRIFTGGLNPASACVDSVGNTYIREETQQYGGSGADYALFRSKLTVAHVAATTTITITGGASAVFYAGDAIKVTGASSLSRAQFAPGVEGTGTTVASTTIIPVTANWIALGEIDASFTSATPGTTGGTWVEDTDINGFESQTLISTTFAQAAVGFAATVTPTQTLIDLAWDIMQIEVPVVEVESITGSSASSKTETFRAATAGDLLLLIVGTNENAGADNITTPTGWTLLAQSRSGTTNVNLNLYGKIAVGGETSVLATGSATARIQTAFANMGQGYSLTIDASNTANSTSASLTGAVGSVTPVTPGGIAISAIAFKNAETTVVAGPANATAYDQLPVSNEGSTASTQKVTLGWFYSENVTTALAYDNAPVATGTAAPYAGLNVVLQPAAASTPQPVGSVTASAGASATMNVTASMPLSLAASASASAVNAVSAPTFASMAVTASASAAVSVTTPTFTSMAATASASATAAVNAAMPVTMAASAGATATTSITSPGLVTLSAAAGATATAAVQTPTKATLGGGNVTSTATLSVTAATSVGSLASTASATASATATTSVPVSMAGAAGASGSVSATAPGRVSMAASAGGTGNVNVAAPALASLAAASNSSATLSVVANTLVGSVAASAGASATASVAANTRATMAGSAAANGSLAVTSNGLVGSLAGSASSVGALSVAASMPVSMAGSAGVTGTMQTTAPGLVTMSATASVIGSAMTVTTPGAQPTGPLSTTASASATMAASYAQAAGSLATTASATGSASVTANTFTTMATTASASGNVSVTANGLVSMATTAIVSATAAVRANTLASMAGSAGATATMSATAAMPVQMSTTASASGAVSVSSSSNSSFTTSAGASATLGVTAPTRVSLSTTASVSATLAATSPTRVTLNSTATATATAAVAAQGPVGGLVSATGGLGSLTVRAPGLVAPQGAGGQAAGSLTVVANGLVGPISSTAAVAATLTVVTAAHGRASTRTLMGMGM